MDRPTREINGSIYSIELYPTSLALLWQDRLVRLGLESAVILAVDAGDLARQNALSDGEALGPERSPLAVAARTFMAALGPTKFNDLVTDMFKSVVYVQRFDDEGNARDESPQLLVTTGKTGGKASDLFEDHYRGNTWEIWQAFQFLIEANYRDFIDGVLSSVKDRENTSAASSLLSDAMDAARAGEKDAMGEALEQLAREVAAMVPADE